MLQKKTRDLITRIILLASLIGFVAYAFIYASNKDRLEKSGSSLVNPDMTVICASSICLEYNNVRECVDLSSPTMFKLEITSEIYNLSDRVKKVFFRSLKSKCDN